MMTHRRLLLLLQRRPRLRRARTIDATAVLRGEHKHLFLGLGHLRFALPGRRQQLGAERVGHADDGAVRAGQREGWRDARGDREGDGPGDGV